eukprot:8800559-Alexandrium_andersonii.AAC.1
MWCILPRSRWQPRQVAMPPPVMEMVTTRWAASPRAEFGDMSARITARCLPRATTTRRATCRRA